MRYSTLFGKAVRDVSNQVKIPSHRLLLQAGFIRESVAGRYFLLPLGMRVKNKITAIIRKNMNEAGAMEMSSPILQSIDLWQESHRDQAGNFGLMCVEDRRGVSFALGGTAEEMFVDVVRNFAISHKELPFNLYQFSQKFRDEARARGGLLRLREFSMKDAYSFDRDEKNFTETYEKMKQVYTKTFDELGLEAKSVPADSGYMRGDFAHEFVVDSEAGETKYLISEDGSYCAHQDVATHAIDFINPDDDRRLMETVERPSWVKTLADMAQHYQQPKTGLLKTVAYKHIETRQIIIAVIRGDLTVNKVKLERAVNAPELLVEATAEDLADLGARPDAIFAWGHEAATYVADSSLHTVRNFIGGQNTGTTDVINVNYERDFKCDIEADISLAKAGDFAADSNITNRRGKRLLERRGIEVGNIFQLGTHYSSRMAAVFVDQGGNQKNYYMGCYGIGIERTLQAIVEIHHDHQGIIWPESVAPFQVHLLSIGRDEDGEVLYDLLLKNNIDVLYDDRAGLSVGRKLADADLIGCPVRLILSRKTGDQIEWKNRQAKQAEHIDQSLLIDRLTRSP